MIIGISGKIGSGKDTIAYHIQESFPEHNFKRRAYAYDVKKVASILTGVGMDVILSREGKQLYIESFDMTIGDMLQKIGDGIKLTVDPESWVKSLFNKEDKDANIIVTDVRHIVEADDIKKRGGILIRVIGDPTGANINDVRDKTHCSETELENYDKWDIVFENKPPIENIHNLINILKQKYDF
jgi:hypothetical protein